MAAAVCRSRVTLAPSCSLKVAMPALIAKTSGPLPSRRAVPSPAGSAGILTPHSAAGSPVGENWEQKVARLRRTSPFSHLPRWALHPVIVKSGDDCRQELMAVQIVSKLQAIFVESGLPLWLRPFEVRSVSRAGHCCAQGVCHAQGLFSDDAAFLRLRFTVLFGRRCSSPRHMLR
jgi:hypothetical protein